MPTYDEYRSAGGQLSKAEYDRLMEKSWAYLGSVTLGGAYQTLPSQAAQWVKKAAFAVLEEYRRQESGGEVSSASNDGYSETYVTSKKTPEQRLYSAAALYLAPSGLLYCGFGGGPC